MSIMITSLNSFQWFSVPLLSEALGVLTAHISLTREEKRKPVEPGCFEYAIPSFPITRVTSDYSARSRSGTEMFRLQSWLVSLVWTLVIGKDGIACSKHPGSTGFLFSSLVNEMWAVSTPSASLRRGTENHWKHSMSDFQLTRLNGQFCPIR